MDSDTFNVISSKGKPLDVWVDDTIRPILEAIAYIHRRLLALFNEIK